MEECCSHAVIFDFEIQSKLIMLTRAFPSMRVIYSLPPQCKPLAPPPRHPPGLETFHPIINQSITPGDPELCVV
jgi:hypothetical protein